MEVRTLGLILFVLIMLKMMQIKINIFLHQFQNLVDRHTLLVYQTYGTISAENFTYYNLNEDGPFKVVLDSR